MVNKFDDFANASEMVCIFNSDDVKAFYGQKEADHYGTFSVVSKCVPGTPILIYDWADKSKAFIDTQMGYHRALYNNFDDMRLGKMNVLRKLVADGVDWLPRTAFTADPGWGGVKFPAICKAANSYDSKGVEKIDAKRDVPDYIDIVQDIILIKREFRVIAFRGKSNDTVQILQLLEKSPKNEKAKDLRVDESLTKEEMSKRPNTKFEWCMLDPAKEPDLIPDISKIVKYLFNDNPGLNFSGFDIAFDGDNKGWYIEHNMIPAPVGPMFLHLYKAMYEDWYKSPICEYMDNRLKELAPKYCQGTKVAFTWDDPMPDAITI